MRVTKRIEEYINSVINKKMLDSVEELKKAADEADRMLNAIVDEEYESMVDNIIRRIPNLKPEDFKEGRNRLFNWYSSPKSHERKAYEEKLTELKNKRKNIVDDILLRMELGGTKDEMDAMLADVKF